MSETPNQRVYVLPSGALTTRLLTWDTLFRAGVKPAELAFVLTAKLRAAMGGEDLSAIQVVLWQALPSVFGQAMQRAIGAKKPVYTLTEEHLNFRYGEFSAFDPKQHIVLLTDSLLTGSTASSLLNTIRRMETLPRAVLCIIDGRRDNGAALTTFAGSVPVFSCFAHGLVLDRAPHDANSLSYVTDSGRRDERELAIDELFERFLQWLKDDKEAAIYIGHIDRGRTRHFATYLNVGSVVSKHPEAIRLLQGRVVHRIGPRLPDVLRVIYPANEGGFAAKLAEGLVENIRPHVPGHLELVPVSRQIDGTWYIPHGPWSDRFTAVVIDWGAVTTATIRVLIQIAAQKGAARIHAFLLTSQLDEATEQAMLAVASIRAKREPEPPDTLQFEEPPPRETVEVPITIDFLSRVSLAMAPASDCHLCGLAQEFRVHVSDAPSKTLREHARRKYDLYTPRTRSDILRGPATDLVGQPLTPDSASEILRIRHNLLKARGSTITRASIRTEILRWVGGEDPRIQSWLQLLVVESYWLKRPPLNAEDIRCQIGGVCVKELLQEGDRPARARSRWQCAIVLRAASKQLFVERFGDLLLASDDDETVSAELSYGMLTLLERPYNHHEHIMQKLLATLMDTRDRLAELRSENPISRNLLATITALYRRAVEIQTRISDANDMFAAWHALQTSYVVGMTSHAGALTSILVVLNAVSGPAANVAATTAAKHSRDLWIQVGNAWSICRDFLSRNVLPFLPVLRDVLERSFGPTGTAGGVAFSEFSAVRAESLGAAIAQMESDPQSFSESVRGDLEREVFAWFEYFLLAPEGGRRKGELMPLSGAHLYRVVSENPCDLGDCWRAALSTCQGAGFKPAIVTGEVPGGVGWQLYCRRSLLTDALAQIVQNAVEKARTAALIPGGITLDVEAKKTDQHVEIRIRNNGTAPSGKGGGGLSFYAAELSLYGATLAGSVTTGEWSYIVTVRIKLW